MKNLHRLFLAVNLPQNLKENLYSYRERWPSLPARWTKPENIHVTLVFLGNANDQETVEVCKTTESIAKKLESFNLFFNRICFGPPGKIPPRMIWAMGKESEELGKLRKNIENAIYESDKKNFKNENGYGFLPHITLARLNQFEMRKMDQEEIPEVCEDIALDFLVESIEVMESELKKGGPIYIVLESARLGK